MPKVPYIPKDLQGQSITHPTLRGYTYGLILTIMCWTGYQFFYVYSTYNIYLSTVQTPDWLPYMTDEIDFNILKEIIVSIATGAGAGLYIGLLSGRMPTRPWYICTIMFVIVATILGTLTSIATTSVIPLTETTLAALLFYVTGALIRDLYDM